MVVYVFAPACFAFFSLNLNAIYKGISGVWLGVS